MSKYEPGELVTVGELEVGDTIFLRQRTTIGEPVPTHAATVAELVPSADGRVQVRAKSVGAGGAVEPRLLGQLPTTREFRRAVLAQA